MFRAGISVPFVSSQFLGSRWAMIEFDDVVKYHRCV